MPAYPPFLLRHTNFRQAESAGQAISTANLDAEFNDDIGVINEINRRLRLLTNTAGQLTNIATQISQALVGTEQFPTTGVETVFLTSIVWDGAFSVGNVGVVINGLTQSQTTYSVADNGGFLEVTTTAPVAAGFLTVAAFSPGAGIETRLLDTTSGSNGANMVGVEDVDAYFVSATVEGALAELALTLNTLLADLGVVADIWTKQGTSIDGSPASADWDIGGFNLKNVADAVDLQDAATLAQVLSLTQSITDLLTIFIRADGAVVFTNDQSMDGNKLTDVGAPTDADDATNKAYVDAADAAVAAGSLAIDGTKNADPLRGQPTGPLTFNQLATNTADVDQATTPAAVVVPTLWGIARPSEASQVANKQYVDETVVGLGLSYKSPIARQTIATSILLDLGIPGGNITNITAGGMQTGDDLTITVPQLVATDLYIFIDGDVDIQSALTTTSSDRTIEIIATGNISISAAITARHIRLVAGGDINVTGGVLLTANRVAMGVVAFDAVGEANVNAAITAAVIIGYAGLSSAWVGAWSAQKSQVGANRYPMSAGMVHGGDEVYSEFQGIDLSRADYTTLVTPKRVNPNQTDGVEIGGSGAGAGGNGGAKTGVYSAAARTYLGAPQRLMPQPWVLPAGFGGDGNSVYAPAGPATALGGGGGGIVLGFVEGDLVLTGWSGVTTGGEAAGVPFLGNGVAGARGGGGTVKVTASGTITDGTATSGGGNHVLISGVYQRGASGAGGVAMLIATAFAGFQTVSAPAGTTAAGYDAAEAGQALALTLTAGQFVIAVNQGLLQR